MDEDEDLGEPAEALDAAKQQLRSAGMNMAQHIVGEVTRTLMAMQGEKGSRPSSNTTAQLLQLAPYLSAAIARYYVGLTCNRTQEPVEIEEIDNLCDEISRGVGRVLRRAIDLRWPGLTGNALEAS